ncbi:hypothetical protein Tco_0650702 [Tanacetum coccineum]
MVMLLMRKVRFHALWFYNIDKTCCGGEACHLDEQNPKCLEDWENLDFQDLVVDGESFQVVVYCCGEEFSEFVLDELVMVVYEKCGESVKKMVFEGDDYKEKVVI